jgi:hypothetical protein
LSKYFEGQEAPYVQPGADNWNESYDLFDDGQITLLDFAEFAKYWLWQEN